MDNLRLFWDEFKEGFKEFGHLISSTINFVLLFLVYCIGIGISSLLGKTFRKRFLKMRLEKSASSYWEPLNLGKRSQEEYYRQF